MSAPIMTTEPAVIRAGDTATWKIALADYPASAGWQITYTLINAAGKITIASSASGSDHLVSVAPSVTQEYAAGTYAWQAKVSNGTDTFTVRHGHIEIKPDFSESATMDTRSHAEKTLAAIESWIEGRNIAVAEYEIAGRKMKYIGIADLMKLRDQYRREVRAERGRESGLSGRIYVRF